MAALSHPDAALVAGEMARRSASVALTGVWRQLQCPEDGHRGDHCAGVIGAAEHAPVHCTPLQ